MKRKTAKDFSLLFFLVISVFLTLLVLSQKQIFQKKAEENEPSIVFSVLPGSKIKRIWSNFAQGGEETVPMLSPAGNEIKKLEPETIRIDHLFDSGELDRRVEEIINLGASPFFALSYFPSNISPNPVLLPASLAAWETLIQKTVERYSGKDQKNLQNIYYEVWNEPDLFGGMTPGQYFNLYRASVTGALKCQNCNAFKIGGPAITTLKTDWLNQFLTLVAQNKIRLDFVSWHSYQVNPAKTLWEAQTLKNLTAYRKLGSPETIISEAGSLPEVSPLHDSYFDAAHTVWAVSLLKDSIDKYFSFELKDGPDPQGKKYWGRWGLLTHQSFGVSPKPRFYSFLYLNKLLDFSLGLKGSSGSLAAIGSTDGKENYLLIASRTNNDSRVLPAKLIIEELPPGLYTTNAYLLSPQTQPTTPSTNQISFNGGVFEYSFVSPAGSTALVEIARTSPSLIKAPGRTGQTEDFAAKVTSFVPPLVFVTKPAAEVETAAVDFWFKPGWGEGETASHTLLETLDNGGNGFRLWTEAAGFTSNLRLGIFAGGQISEELTFPLPDSWKTSAWHQFSLVVDNPKLLFRLIVDGQETLLPINPGRPVKFGNFFYLGGNELNKSSAEGAIDDLQIVVNGELLYQKTFN